MSRQKSRGETHEERLGFYAKPSFKAALEQYAERMNTGMSDILREATETYLNGLLPVIAVVPCGPLQEAIESTPYYEMVPPMLRPRADLNDFLLQASGSSMSPRIESGDLIMVRPGIEWSEGDVCAVQVYENDDQSGDCYATMKRVFRGREDGTVILRSYNPEFEDIVVPAKRAKVIGVMRGLMKPDG